MLDSPSRAGGPGSQRRSSKGDDRGGGGGSTAAVMGISFTTELGEEMWIEVDYPAKAEVLASWWWSPSRTGLRRGRSHGSRRRRSRHASQLGEDMCRGYVSRGKRREAGCYSTSRGLPKALQIAPGKLAPADFSHQELTGNPVGKWASKLALKSKQGPSFKRLPRSDLSA